ncbi:PREDICTED: uncharacterized protein LOC104803983 [Tarenaya hassleriana]|uniref:uncharacterized protein LOC104803957 n=1 Tax=Tarenaya hassleriana TaxID=28532 RepID=UPI00053C1250|nr:PREDICTED: uncharacterized protein LOC104803957 [Tarenaya hassleriana]XP_010526406.1 PREDICTED: uncharacterized protein LOC104803983 [Tarenaya hassleriana]
MAEEPEKEPSSTSQQSSGDTKPDDADIKSQASAPSGFQTYPNGDFPMYPVWYPFLAPGMNPTQYEEQTNRGAGIYAVPVLPFTGHVAGLPSNNLIPLTYNIPTTRSSNEAATGGDEHAQGGQQQQGQQQEPAHQRQVVVRRFQIAFQLDLFLILKLAAVIFLFNQDGSRQRLAVLVFFASIIYLYQTGALTPLVQWLSQGMQRAAAAPRHQRPALRADNDPAAARPQNDNAAPEGQGREENEAQHADNGNRANENENPVEAEVGNQWWGIVKEIQMIVFGFITSLLPGFHNLD